MQVDYTAIGHVTVDLLEDGSRQPGGTVLYSALQASRLGLRSLIVTRGVPGEIEELLTPWAAELELRVEPAAQTTTLATSGQGAGRSQRLLAWAGPIAPPESLDCAVLHLAPVANELPEQWPTGGRLVGLTPQGLLRSWPPEGGTVVPSPPSAGAIAQARDVHAIVISETEREACAELLDGARAAGALIAVTAGDQPVRILAPGSEPIELPVRRVADPCDDLGAGDCYAAALFTGLAEGRSSTDAAMFASAAATMRMLGPGPQAVGTRAAIEATIAPAPRPSG